MGNVPFNGHNMAGSWEMAVLIAYICTVNPPHFMEIHLIYMHTMPTGYAMVYLHAKLRLHCDWEASLTFIFFGVNVQVRVTSSPIGAKRELLLLFFPPTVHTLHGKPVCNRPRVCFPLVSASPSFI